MSTNPSTFLDGLLAVQLENNRAQNDSAAVTFALNPRRVINLGPGITATDNPTAVNADGTIGRTELNWSGGLFGSLTPPPLAANWTNLGSQGTIANSGNTLLVTPGTSQDTIFSYNGWTTSNTTLTVATSQSTALGGSGNPGFGIVIRNSAVTSTNVGYVRFVYYNASDDVLHLQIQEFTGSGVPGSAGSVILDVGGVPPQSSLFWQQFIWNPTTGVVTLWTSNNGVDWVQVGSITPFQTSPAPVIQVGIIPMSAASGQNIPRLQSMVVV
jgi:hypothetical protein